MIWSLLFAEFAFCYVDLLHIFEDALAQLGGVVDVVTAWSHLVGSETVVHAARMVDLAYPLVALYPVVIMVEL